MRSLAIAALLTIAFAGAAAAEKKVSKEATAAIEKALAEIGCKPGDIEAGKGGGYEVDDVECKDGQYDVKLDKDFKITGKKKE